MLSSFVRVHFSCLYFDCPKKHLLPFIRIQRAFVPNFFQKIFSAPLIAQLMRRLYEKILVVAKNPLITSRDKNRSFDSLFSKNSEIFSPVKTSPYLIRHKKPFLLPSFAHFLIQRGRYFTSSNNALYLIRQIFAFWAVSHRKKSPHCIGHGNAIFRSPLEKIHKSFTVLHLRGLFASLQKSPSI